MSKFIYHSILTILVLCLAACSKDPSVKKMEHIKMVGNDDPVKALEMLDSIEMEVRDGNEYAQMKYDLLQIRLSDKADILPTSDFKIKKVIDYFEKEGTPAEKQEANYYAGSVYRDLQDTPRSLEYFFKSIDYAKDNDDCDAVMLRNTYSNLHFLQFRVQNYKEALSMAKEEERLSKVLGQEDVISYMQVGSSYNALDSIKQSMAAYEKAFQVIAHSKDKSEYQENLIRLLMDYSDMKEMKKASLCKSYISDKQSHYLSILKDMAFIRYYEACGKNDSVIIYGKHIIDYGTDANNMYDAAKQLFRLYEESGDAVNAAHYANIYMQLSDSIDFGKRQELAATVNNAYQYHLDEKKEQTLKDERNKYIEILGIVLLCSVSIIVFLLLLYKNRRNRQLRKVTELSSKLDYLSCEDRQLQEELRKKEAELQAARDSLSKSTDELQKVKNDYDRVNSELEDYNDALKEKEQQLSEKIDQNKTFIKLLHQSELEGKAEDVIHAIRQSSIGKKNMTSADWKQLYNAVDELYPDFRNKLLEELGTFTEQQMQVCYLMRIGLSNPQIQNMTDMPRATVWRWVKKYDWALMSNETPKKTR